MSNRLATIYRQRTLADSGEETYDLNLREPITALYVEFRNTNGATDNQNNHIADDVDEIQVVDGSDVLFSMDGEEFVAYQHYLGYKEHGSIWNELAGLSQVLSGWIPFGRFRNDPVYGLDPMRFRNLQVRIKWSYSAAVTAWVTGSARFSLFADLMLGASAPMGLIMAKEIKSWTTAASGDERTELPTDHPYLGLLIQAFVAGTAPDSIITDLKVTVDTDRLILVNNDVTDLLKLMDLWYGAMTYRHTWHATNGGTIRTVPKKDEEVVCMRSDGNDTVFGYPSVGVGQAAISVYAAGSAYGSKANINGIVQGFAPYGCLYWPFGRHAEPQEWLQVGDFRRLEAVCTQGTASAEGKIVTVQARNY